jgi:hypothetical protein
METKVCTKCKDRHPATTDYFSPRPITASKDGLYSWCKECMKLANDTWRANNPELVKEKNRAAKNKARIYRAQHPEYEGTNRRARYLRYRNDALDHYSNGNLQCTCPGCPVIEREFLALDHIEGGGGKHRKETGRGFAFFYWLRRNGFPPLFQLLCHNCNMAKAFYGVCPHQNSSATHGKST